MSVAKELKIVLYSSKGQNPVYNPDPVLRIWKQFEWSKGTVGGKLHTHLIGSGLKKIIR